jgi:lipoprotein-anchoring transpeptidase ErfK/SrfK
MCRQILASLGILAFTLTTAAAQQERPSPTSAKRQAKPAGTTGQAKPAGTTGKTADKPSSAPVVSETLAVQVMLDRSGFSPGEIDGRPGPNFQRALSAFQRANGLGEVADLDDATWKQMIDVSGVQQPVTYYEVTAEDVAGPFVEKIPAELPDQAKLPQLGYTSALERLAEKFHSSPALLKALNPKATFSSAGERLSVPNVEVIDIAAKEPKTAAAGAVLVVRKATSALTIEDASGRVLLHAPVTVGSEHDPLPIGTWKVNGVQRMPKFHYNPALFWDADPGHAKATIPAGPNNPVGVAWIDISKPHYGIHGTPEPSRVGHTESHGCIRLTNWDVARVAQWVKPGMKVVFE